MSVAYVKGCIIIERTRLGSTRARNRGHDRGVGERRGNELGMNFGGWTSRWVTIS